MLRAGKIPRSNKPEAERIFEQANQFYEGALRCLSPVKTDGGKLMPMTPAIVNLAFASELYIKSQLKADSVSARGHRLIDLLDRLSERRKTAWQRNYALATKRSTPQIVNDISTFSNAFVEWRYIYEQQTPIVISVHRLAALTASLYKMVREAQPGWEVGQALSDKLNRGPDTQVIYLKQLNTGEAFRAILSKT